MSGTFITFEGGEGCGKSTQARRLVDRLNASGRAARLVREPGGTAVGEAVRAIVLDPEHEGLDARAELMLYEASRAQLVADVIEPALEAGEVVVCDRFTDSSLAYQGFGRGLPLADIRAANEIATAGLTPRLTILLELPVAVGLVRATGGGADRLESEDVAFHERVRAGFHQIAQEEPERFRIIDATGAIDVVKAAVNSAVAPILTPAHDD